MKKHDLAQELRERQIKAGILPRAIVYSVSDDDIIESYTTCSQCGQKWLEGKQLDDAIAEAENANHFLAICSRAGEGDQH